MLLLSSYFFFCAVFLNHEKIFLKPTGKTFQVEKGDSFLSSPKQILFIPEKQSLLLLDAKTLQLFSWDLSSKHCLVFGEQGEGPQGFQNKVLGLFIGEQEHLVVLHAGGKRKTTFDIQGKLIEARSLPLSAFYSDGGIQILKKGNLIILEKNGIKLDETEAFSFESYGFETNSLRHGQFVFLLTGQSRDGSISYITFDLKNERLHDLGKIEKILKFNEDDIPGLKQMGAPAGFFYGSNYSNVFSHPTLGIVIKEYAPKGFLKKENFIGKSVVRCLNPETRKIQTLIFHHPEIEQLDILIPLVDSNAYLGFDYKEDQFLWLVKKSSP